MPLPGYYGLGEAAHGPEVDCDWFGWGAVNFVTLVAAQLGVNMLECGGVRRIGLVLRWTESTPWSKDSGVAGPWTEDQGHFCERQQVDRQ